MKNLLEINPVARKGEPDQLDKDCDAVFSAMKGWTYQRQEAALEQTLDYLRHMMAMDEAGNREAP